MSSVGSFLPPPIGRSASVSPHCEGNDLPTEALSANGSRQGSRRRAKPTLTLPLHCHPKGRAGRITGSGSEGSAPLSARTFSQLSSAGSPGSAASGASLGPWRAVFSSLCSSNGSETWSGTPLSADESSGTPDDLPITDNIETDIEQFKSLLRQYKGDPTNLRQILQCQEYLQRLQAKYPNETRVQELVDKWAQ